MLGGLGKAAGDVELTGRERPSALAQRGGEPLVRQRQSTVDRDRDGLRLAVALVAVAVEDWPASSAAKLAGPFPWIALLPEAERDEFARELVATGRACAAVSAFQPLAVTISAWESTAQAYAHGYTPDDDLEWLDQAEPVERPGT